MNKEFIYRQLLNILDEESIKVDELMKKHITFKVGGPADFLVKPKTEEELRKVIKFAKEENIPFLVIGNGSNLLVKDGGIRGIVIELSDNFNNYEIEGNIIKYQSGALLSILRISLILAWYASDLSVFLLLGIKYLWIGIITDK